MIPFLLALQAGGMIVDYMGRRHSIDMANQGYELEKQQIERSIQLSRLQTEDESLQSLHELRQNLGTQAAVLAARGNTGTAGIIAMTESIHNQGVNERMRRINQESTEAQLRSNLQIAKLNNKRVKNEQWSAFTKNIINRFPTSPQAYQSADSFLSNFGITKVT